MRFAIWHYNGKKWVVSKETVIATTAEEAKPRLIKKLGDKHKKMKYPTRTVIV